MDVGDETVDAGVQAGGRCAMHVTRVRQKSDGKAAALRRSDVQRGIDSDSARVYNPTNFLI